MDLNPPRPSATTRCGCSEAFIFVTMLASGTVSSIWIKILLDFRVNMPSGEIEQFSKPTFLTLNQFFSMSFALALHWFVACFKLPFPGYGKGDEHKETQEESDDAPDNRTADISEVVLFSDSDTSCEGESRASAEEGQHVSPTGEDLDEEWTPSSISSRDVDGQENHQERASSAETYTVLEMHGYLFLAALSCLVSYHLRHIALQYLDASIHQLLGGSGLSLICVAILKQKWIGHRLYSFQWLGLAWVLLSTCLVGVSALLNSSTYQEEGEVPRYTPTQTGLGIGLNVIGAIAYSFQLVFEEKVMNMGRASAKPLFVAGMEGVWGLLITVVVLYPMAQLHTGASEPFVAFQMIQSSSWLQINVLINSLAKFAFNVTSLATTFALNSVWTGIANNFETISVWVVNLMIFYLFTNGSFGEPWAAFSWMQLLGLGIMLYGASIYNAPNPGCSLMLKGQWYNCCFDFSSAYEAAQRELSSAATRLTDDSDSEISQFEDLEEHRYDV